MSTPLRYLAPTRARSNPGYLLEWRHGEGGPWLPMTTARARKDVASELSSPPVPLVQGDLVRVLDHEGGLVGFSVQTDEGLLALPSGDSRSVSSKTVDQEMKAWHRASGYDWERAWEGSVRADWLLFLADKVGVDRRLVVLAACDCAETALHHLPPGEDRPRRALEAARRWARGEATPQEVEAAGETSSTFAVWAPGGGASASWASISASWVAGAATRYATHGNAAKAASCAAWASDAAWDAALASLAPLVRQWIPLSGLALALVGRAP